jgi:hypothetical protein
VGGADSQWRMDSILDKRPGRKENSVISIKKGHIHMETESKFSKYQKELLKLVARGQVVYFGMARDLGKLAKKSIPELEKYKKELAIGELEKEYEAWYSEALMVVKQIIPERANDFISLYKNDKRKEISFATYTMSDYLIGLRTTLGERIIADQASALPKFKQQLNILQACEKRFGSSLFDIKQLLIADIFDDELDSARELLKKGFVRASGAVAGVVLEKHLSQVAAAHQVALKKKDPGISDFNDALKAKDIIDIPKWRSIQHLADLRNLCDHNKKREPKPEEVDELISGIEKVIKTLF